MAQKIYKQIDKQLKVILGDLLWVQFGSPIWSLLNSKRSDDPPVVRPEDQLLD